MALLFRLWLCLGSDWVVLFHSEKKKRSYRPDNDRTRRLIRRNRVEIPLSHLLTITGTDQHTHTHTYIYTCSLSILSNHRELQRTSTSLWLFEDAEKEHRRFSPSRTTHTRAHTHTHTHTCARTHLNLFIVALSFLDTHLLSCPHVPFAYPGYIWSVSINSCP